GSSDSGPREWQLDADPKYVLAPRHLQVLPGAMEWSDFVLLLPQGSPLLKLENEDEEEAGAKQALDQTGIFLSLRKRDGELSGTASLAQSFLQQGLVTMGTGAKSQASGGEDDDEVGRKGVHALLRYDIHYRRPKGQLLGTVTIKPP
ncbi:unnamed protein product, partial [Amoebophrya sp. A25]